MKEDKGSTIKNRMLTPLWIISLFIGLTEAIVGIAITQTDGSIQVALTIFIIVFPVIIALGFFLLIWYKPYHLYAPGEYGQSVDIQQYVTAITQRHPFAEDNLYQSIQDVVHSTLTSEETISGIVKALQLEDMQAEKQVTQALNSIADTTIEKIKQAGFLTIDTTPMKVPEGRVWQVSYDRYEKVSFLLNAIWYSLQSNNRPPAFTYGKTWVLRDANTGYLLPELGNNSRYAKDNFDERSLEDAHIMPGMHLEAIPLKESSL